MNVRRAIACFTLAAMTIAITPAHGQAFVPAMIANVKAEGQSRQMEAVRGSCNEKSHIAVGPIGTDLARQQTPFSCDAAVITFYDQKDSHVMITFAQRATTKNVISFAGTMDKDGVVMDVRKVYFEPGKATYIDDGACKFFLSGKHMTAIFCIGKIDSDGQRTVAMMSYDAEPGQ